MTLASLTIFEQFPECTNGKSSNILVTVPEYLHDVGNLSRQDGWDEVSKGLDQRSDDVPFSAVFPTAPVALDGSA
jgi:hypothetical protein